MSRFIDSGILIVILTAFWFALSVANYNGYLAAIGVESGFILRNSHQILYNSLFVILSPILNVAIWSIAACFCLYFIANIYSYVLRDSLWMKKKISKFNLRNKKAKMSRVELNTYKLIKLILPIALGALVLFWGLIKSEEKGKELGYELIKKIKKSDYLPHDVINIKDYKSKIYVVSCGIHNCAGINVDTMKVEYFENKFLIGTTSNDVNRKSDSAGRE